MQTSEMGNLISLVSVRDDISDQQQVISKLEMLLSMARAGKISGMMFVARTRDNKHSYASAGWYAREPRESLVPALLGIIDLCSHAGK